MSLLEELMEADLLIYDLACPNCEGPISDSRLMKGCPCTSCVGEVQGKCRNKEFFKKLKRQGRLRKLRDTYSFLSKYRSLSEFFKRCVGNEPWSIQRLWLKRIAKGSSFAMIAPTGVGKTTFGLVIAMYLAMHGRKSYIVVPTTTLATQVADKLEELSSRADVVIQPLVIHSHLKKKERKALEERLSGPGDFDILVTTSNYLLRNPEKILKHDFAFVFVDDVDAVLRGSRAINYILRIMRFSEEDFELGIKAIRLKRELAINGGNKGIAEELKRIEERFARKRSKSRKVLVISSATGNPRGLRVRLFRELLGFEIGTRPELIRNIDDLFALPSNAGMEEAVLKAVRLLGGGGLIYVPVDKGVEYAEFLADYLRKKGVKAEALHSKKVSAIESFIAGETRVLVGVATYYGVLVRGLDLPEVVRYAVFAGAPRHKVGLRLRDIKPQDVLRLLPIVREAVKDEGLRRDLESRNARLRRLFMKGGTALTQTLTKVLRGERRAETRGEKLFIETYEELKKLLSKPEVVEGIRSNPNVAVVKEGNDLYVLIPDAATYIQASGRTSRLFLGGISKGISLIIVDDERLLKGLERKLRWIFEDFRFKELKEVNIEKLLEEVDRSRELIRKVRAGETPKELVKKAPIELKTALLVVESPNKARTIAKFFGKPSMREYGKLRVYEASLGGYTLLITATQGHIYDIATSIPGGIKQIYGVALRERKKPRFIPYYGTIKKCLKCGTQFVTPESRDGKSACPICGSEEIADKKDVIEALRDVSLEVDEVLIGTDPDTEGEKIAFDIANVLKPYAESIRRVEFHEVTRKAIINAVKNPREIDLNLVKAQMVRRIEDRWLGFSLSKNLQTEFWRSFCDEVKGRPEDSPLRRYEDLCRKFVGTYRNLSAGRVQTPVLGWIIETYEKHVKSKTLFLTFRLGELRLEIPLKNAVRKEIRKSKPDTVIVTMNVDEIKEESVNPPPPYTTDAALYDINFKLKISAQTAMQLLQDLFELGFITYHRTDSTRVSDAGIAVAKEYLKETLKEEMNAYFQPRGWGEGGAHECIRPTRPVDADTLRSLIAEGVIEPVRRLTRAHFAVYDLIFRRFIASQTKPAKVRKVKGNAEITILLKNGSTVYLGKHSVETVEEVIFDGFNAFYKIIYPRKLPGRRNEEFRVKDFKLKEWYTEPLHTQATLIKEMKNKEIGRPSTYAKILETLFKRKYVMQDRSRFKGIIPLPLGRKVHEYLTRRFGKLVSEERTRELERRMKLIEKGKVRYEDVLEELYNELRSANLLGGESGG